MMTQFGWHADSQGEIKYLMTGVKERCVRMAHPLLPGLQVRIPDSSSVVTVFQPGEL